MQVFDKYGVPTVRIGLSIVYLTYIYRVSNVYLSCIYRIYNVVDSELVAGDNRSLAGRAVDGSSLRCRSGSAL